MEQQNGAGGVATAAKDQAGQVGQTAAQAGGQVAQTTKEQAANVVGEAKQQARDLVGEARTQVGDQAGQQKGRAVEGLRSLAGELDDMAQQGRSGIATEVARQVASRAHGLADHLDRHEPAELLDQVRSYARRRPVVFLTGAAVLGVLAGRMTRNLASSDDSGPAALPSGSAPRSLTTENGYGTPAAHRQYEAIEPVPAYPGGGFETVGADPAVTTDPGLATGPGATTDPAFATGPGTTTDPAYATGPAGTADPAVAGGYEPDYSGGFRTAPDTGYEPDYQAGYQPAPDTGLPPATQFDPATPGSTHQGERDAEDREWRNA